MSITQINDRNIHNLVEIYIENKDSLPTDLKNVNIGDWDVTYVTDMSRLFENKEEFNEPLHNWNVSKVTDMSSMFAECVSFNQPLNDWNVSNVTDMSRMFFGCVNLDQPLNKWVVSKVTSMENMFGYNKLFNQTLNDWNVGNVKYMEGMFSNCSKFNESLDKWDVSNITSFLYMFEECTNFNQSLNNWNVSNVNNFMGMFDECAVFNSPLNDWNVSNATEMGGMFNNCKLFNQPLNNWNVGNVENMQFMFNGCESFNQPINNWNVRYVTESDSIFDNCPIEEQNKPLGFRNPQHIARVDPYQIHKESAKVNYSKLTEVLNEKMNINIPENINYGNYINETLLKIINESDDSETIKNEQKDGLNRIMTERLNGLSYSDFPQLQLKTIFYTLQYVMTQPAEFQNIYVDTFIKECVHAYEGSAGMTCAAGALERIVNSLINPCQTLLSKGENTEYEKIIAIIIAKPGKLIPEYIQDWYKLHKIGTPDAFPSGTSVEQKKANLKEYLLEKLPQDGELIDEKIVEIADNIGYDDDVFMYGGRKRKNKTTIKNVKPTRSRKGKKTNKIRKIKIKDKKNYKIKKKYSSKKN